MFHLPMLVQLLPFHRNNICRSINNYKQMCVMNCWFQGQYKFN